MTTHKTKQLFAETEPTWEWPVWLISIVVLPFLPILSGAAILVLTGRRLWQSRETFGSDQDLWLLLVWVGLIMASLFSAINPKQALLGALNFIPFVAIFAVLVRSLTNIQRLRQLAWAVFFPSVLIALIGIGELWWGWSALNDDHGFVRFIDWELQLVAGGKPPGRMSSVFLHANSLANYTVMVWALGLGLWCDASSIQSTHSPIPRIAARFTILRSPRFYHASLGFVLLLNAGMLIFSSSRNGWLISSVTLLVFLIYRNWWRVIAAIHAGLTIILVAAFAPEQLASPFRLIVPYAIWSRLNDQMYPDRPVASLRLTQWQYTLEMIQQRPFGGWGFQSFSSLYEAKYGFFLGHPHNLYLMLAAETGLVATIVLMIFVSRILLRVCVFWFQEETPTAAQPLVLGYFTAFLATSGFHMFDTPLFQVQVNFLGWILLASLVGVHRNIRSSQLPKE